MAVDIAGTEHGVVWDLVFTNTTAGLGITVTQDNVTRGVGNHHGVMVDAAASITTEQGLMLAVDETSGEKIIEELRLPPIPPRVSEGEFDFTHTDPLTEMVFSQDDWSEGGFQATFDPNDPNKYARASGMDLR